MLNLLPQPRQLTALGGQLSLANHKLILLDAPEAAKLRLMATRLQQTLTDQAQLNWSIVAGTRVPSDQVGLRISVVPNAIAHAQGYQLTIKPNGLLILASSPVGAYYGVLTLCQILSQCHGNLPLLYITDWPDFPQRGVMLDVSRNRVPTMLTLYELIDLLASWKINQIQLYLEHTFAYRQHPVVWANASPLTGEEILAIDAYCRERFIELVPNQNSFGHMRPWLIHEPYRHLAECPDGCDTGSEEWGYFDEPFTLDPSNPGSLNLVRSMMDELLPHFTSRQFNIGGDEPVELGFGHNQKLVAEKGKGRV
jgi:N-acetyl-beta-hexosaminidase